MARVLITIFAALLILTPDTHAQSPQNPSPMVETTRTHERIEPVEHPGMRRSVEVGLPAPVHVFIPEAPERFFPQAPDTTDAETGLLIHFMGEGHIAEHALAKTGFHDVLAVVNLGSGSSAFERPLRDDGAFGRLIDSVAAAASEMLGRPIRFDHIDLSAFSAGYGAVRAILDQHAPGVHGILLLDALHTGYVPEQTPPAQGGRLDTTLLAPFVRFARRAASGENALVLTHSTVFPGTFASTTETSDYLLEGLGVPRTAVLAWGPVGMQQVSEAGSGGFRVLGFAGNSAPDHVDHLHGLAAFLPLLHDGEIPED